MRPRYTNTILYIQDKVSIMIRRRGQKSLTKMYKDLMITKRQLIDLRQSISQTISGLKSQKYTKHRIEQKQNRVHKSMRKRPCYECGYYQDPACPHVCNKYSKRSQILICERCCECFDTLQKLQIHNESRHMECQRCHCRVGGSQSDKIHQQYYCGQARVQCERCGADIKRKQIDHHHQLCCFQVCHKCKKCIYYKAINYHIGECRKQTGKSSKIKRVRQPKQKHKSARIYPCSLMN